MDANKSVLWLIRALVFMMASLPFLITHHRMPLNTFYAEFSAFGLGLLLIAVIVWRYGLALWWPLLTPLILLPIVAYQWLAGFPVIPQDVAGFSLFVGWAVLLASALLAYRRQSADGALLTWLAAGAFAGALLNGLVVLLQQSVANLPGVFYPNDGAVVGNIAQQNLLITYLMAGVLSGIYLYETGKLRAALLAPAMLLLALGIALAAGRIGILYSLMLLGTVLLDSASRHNRRRLRATIGFVSAYALFLLLDPVIRPLFGLFGLGTFGKFFSDDLGGGMLDGMRRFLLAVAWDMFKGAPWFGQGVGTFDQAAFWRPLDAGPAPGILSNVTHSHNIVANFAAELGIFSLLPLFVLLGVTIRRGVADSSAAGHWARLLAACLILHSLIDFPLWSLHFLALLVLALAFLGAPDGTPSLRPQRYLRGAVAIAVAGVALLAVIYERDYRAIEHLHVDVVMRPDLFDREHQRLSSHPLFGGHAAPFVTAMLVNAPGRVAERMAICDRTIKTYTDISLLRQCAYVFDQGGQSAYVQRIVERVCFIEQKPDCM